MEEVSILVSGGIESSVLLYELSSKFSVSPIYIKSGYIWEDTEVKYVKKLTSDLNLDLKTFNIPVEDIYSDHWSLTGEEVPGENTEDSAVELPGRNILLLSKTALFCSLNNIQKVYLGTLDAPFSDAKSSFFSSLSRSLSQGLDHSIEINTPYRGNKKSKIIEKGFQQNVPLDKTFSCIQPTNGEHCGSCNKCSERKKAFKNANIKDPTCYS